MKDNPESSKLDKLRMAIGTFLALAGVLCFLAAWLVGLTNLTLTFTSIILIVGGIVIAGSHRLADLIAGLMR